MILIDSLISKIKQTSSVVLGIDPNFELLPENFRPTKKSEIEKKLDYFCKEVISASKGLVCGVKFQSAYFERFGLVGLKALSRGVKFARENDLLVILDAKRGDIGSTNLAYANAYFEKDSDFETDFLTVNPFLGLEAAKPFFEVSRENNKGLFALVKTSNPDSNLIQDALLEGKTVSENVAEFLNKQNLENLGEFGFGNFGAVVGATKASEIEKLRELMPNTFWLVPGFGAQGGDYSLVKNFLNKDKLGAIFPMSRELTYPTENEINLNGYREAVKKRIERAIQLIKS